MISSYSKYSDDEILSKIGIKYLDIAIENISNKSIDIDIEMKVFKGEGYTLISEPDLREELNNKLGKNNGYYPIPVISNLWIYFQDYKDYVIITKNLRTSKTDLSIKQNSKEIDVFEKYLYVIEEKSNTIHAEVFIRSDDFTDGVLIKKTKFKT